jgi:hypothetical protein
VTGALALGAIAAPASAGAGDAGKGTGAIASGESSTDRTGGGTASKYARLWDKVSRKDRRWAGRTAWCESGRDPKALGAGGAYRGAFMFLMESWKNAPKSPGGDPIDYSYRTQAVVAVALKHQMGTSPWPVCG